MHRRKIVSLAISESLRLEAVARILADHDFLLAQRAGSIDELDDGIFAADEILMLSDCVFDRAERTDCIRRLLAAQPGLRIVILADARLANEVPELMAAGIFGVILSSVPWQAVVTMLMTVAMGERVIPSETLDILSDRKPRLRGHDLVEQIARYGLTDREGVILARIGRGMPDKAISSELGVSESTVKANVKTLFRKLGVTNRTQAAVMTR